MKWTVLLITVFVCGLAGTSFGQAPSQCPVGFVCISPDAARKALQDSDLVTAQAAELAVKDAAIADHKKLEADLKIELAKAIGEKTQLEAAAVRYTAIIDALLRNFKKSHKFGILNIN